MTSSPSRTLPSPSESYNRVQSEQDHDDSHRSNDVDIDNPSIDSNQNEAPTATSTMATFSTPTPSRTTLQSTRHQKSPSHITYKRSLPHRRVLRSFPRLPHAFVQPSTNRYLPYTPISITVRQTVERYPCSIDDKKAVEEEQPVLDSANHDGSGETKTEM